MKKKEKQWLSIALSAAMVVTGIPATGIGTTVQAASGEAQVSVKNGEVTIGNEYLERKFSTSDNKLATTELDNKRADLTFTPAQGSEEFIIKLRQDGTTKLDGELAVSETLDKYFIVRIAWVFGKNGNNFIKTMLKVGKNHDKLRVVNDQIGTPTYTFDLARLLVDMIETDKYGYYHATNEGGYISWYDFTKEIFRQAVKQGHTEYGEDRITVNPVTTAEYGVSKAARPFNSRLDKKKLVENGFTPLPTWQDALGRYLKELNIDEL